MSKNDVNKYVKKQCQTMIQKHKSNNYVKHGVHKWWQNDVKHNVKNDVNKLFQKLTSKNHVDALC